MAGMEMHTAAELGLPVTWVVLNNAGNAMVHNIQQGLFGRSVSSMYHTPLDVAAIARALGAQGVVARSLAQFQEALLNALASPGPTAIDARVDPDEVPWALAGRITTLRNAFDGTSRTSNGRKGAPR
jgi:acetolactate synthase-1/2/3 large subunit